MKSPSIRSLVIRSVIFQGVFLFIFGQAHAFFLENWDFESGDLSGWTVFKTPNGTLGDQGTPTCVDFDIKGDGHVTKSVEFKVGQQQYDKKGASLAGGGIFTHLSLGTGNIVISVNVASSYSSSAPNDKRNLAGGLFELLVDGEVVASHDFGPILNHTIQRFTLDGRTAVSAGRHELRIRIRRPFRSFPNDHAPRQYLDNIQVKFSPA